MVVYFFQAGALFCIDNAKFWPILTILLQIYALFVVLFTGLNNAVAYQKGQLSGMSDDIIARVMEYLILFMEP